MTTGKWSLRWLALLLAGAMLALVGCSASPPGDLDSAAKELPGAIKQARGDLKKAKADFNAKLGSSKFAFMAGYTAQQTHADRFSSAKSNLDKANKIYGSEIKPAVEDYEGGRKAELTSNIARANKLLGEAKTLTNDPARWLDTVAGVKADPNGTVRRASTSVGATKEDFDSLNKRVGDAEERYGNNAEAIQAKFTPVSSRRSDALQANGLLQAEVKKNPPNYALMAVYAASVERGTAAFNKDAPALNTQLNELDSSETHTLLDLRVDSYVEISRTSWDDNSDYDTDEDYDYPPVKVDLDTANYFAKFGPNDVLAKQTSGWGGGFSYEAVEKSQWTKLRIDSKQDWISGHTDAEYFVSLDETYCNQVRVLRNGKAGSAPSSGGYCSQYDTDTDRRKGIYWVESDELRTDAMGMDIYAKGTGDFADQATTAATPPGMVYVGDEATGEWREDDNGHTFWHYYGQYMFFSQLIGGTDPYHYRSEWGTWNGKYRYAGKYGKTYYAPTSTGVLRYGPKSPFMKTRFPGSAYVKSGLGAATVRGAGPAARAGGPGNGGK